MARARASADDELPETTGGAMPNGPPPAHRWAERDPAAAARLAAARGAVTALAEENRLPVENLLVPRRAAPAQLGSAAARARAE